MLVSMVMVMFFKELPAPFLSRACCQHGVSRLRGSEGSVNMPVAAGQDFQSAVIYRPDPLENIAAPLLQARAPKPFQVMRPVRLMLERHFA